eukprot:6173714-Pleurochrysis_carterae.AAC.3
MVKPKVSSVLGESSYGTGRPIVTRCVSPSISVQTTEVVSESARSPLSFCSPCDSCSCHS